MDDYAKRYCAEADALDDVSTALERHAGRLRQKAESLRASARRWEQHVRRLGAAPHLVNHLRAEGSANPIEDAATLLGVLPEFVQAHYREFCGRSRKASLRQRNRRICQLARNGLTNDEIAGQVKVSISTVQRALREADLGSYIRPRKLP